MRATTAWSEASAKAAEAAGLAGGKWYHTAFDRQEMKTLMVRSDGPALRDTAIWWGMMLAAAAGGVAFWGSVMALPFFALYGVLYGSASDSRWHECGHGTAFKTPWMNNLVYQVASFMIMREPEVTRASHARHHTDTLIVGRDPEIAVKRPPNIPLMLLSFLAVEGVYKAIVSMVRHSLGRLTADERDFIPERVRGRGCSGPRASGWRSMFHPSPWRSSCRAGYPSCWSARCPPCTAPGWRGSSTLHSTPGWQRTCSITASTRAPS